MRSSLLVAMAILAAVGSAHAQVPAVSAPTTGFPCVNTGPGTADCTIAMAQLAKVAKIEPESPGIPVKSSVIESELTAVNQAINKMLINQIETNRLLAQIAESHKP